MYKITLDDMKLLTRVLGSRCAKTVTKYINSLNELGTLPKETIESTMGEDCYQRIAAMEELFRRISSKYGEKLDTAKAVSKNVYKELWHPGVEKFSIVQTDAGNNLISTHTLFSGVGAQVQIDIPKVMRFLILHGIERYFLVHNHPSGDPTATPNDLRVTQSILTLSRVLGYEMVDHVILGDSADNYYTIRGNSYLWSGVVAEAADE
jgi:DNA repair protein RadC